MFIDELRMPIDSYNMFMSNVVLSHKDVHQSV